VFKDFGNNAFINALDLIKVPSLAVPVSLLLDALLAGVVGFSLGLALLEALLP